MDRSNLKIGFNNRPVHRETGVDGTQHLGARTPTHIIFNDKVPRIKIRLRSNPHMIANFSRSIETPLKVRLCPDENPVADFESLQVFKPDAGTDPDPIAEFARYRSPDGPAQEPVQFSIAIRKSRIMLQESGRRVTAPEMPG